MLLNSWSIALLICAAGVIFLVTLAGLTSVKVLLYWDAGSDSERQIELEGRTLLSAALVENALIVQSLSLVLLVLAADQFSHVIAGAMCATGTFLANVYGIWALYCKIASIFFCGFWIVLHRLDLCSEYFPLVKVKNIYLLLLLPLLYADSYVLVSYLADLKPDIITSCCGVIFSDKRVEGNFAVLSFSREKLVAVFYLLGAALLGASLYLKKNSISSHTRKTTAYLFYGIAWLAFFLLSLLAITTFFSSYIYALPSHNCPFDILQSEYNYIGYPLYFSLFSTTFLGMSCTLVQLCHLRPGLSFAVTTYQKFATGSAFWLLMVFVFLVTYPVVTYLMVGGEL